MLKIVGLSNYNN